MLVLLVDYREKSFIRNLNFDVEVKTSENIHKTLVNGTEVFYQIANLPVGDFILKQIEPTEEYQCIVERKTIKDLYMSITDGRFRQQKERLIESIRDPQKVLFVIEGSKKNYKAIDNVQNNLSEIIVDSSIQNLIFKHNFKVINTENEADTFNNIILLYKKFSTHEFENSQTPKSTPIKLVSKTDKVKNNIMSIQLCAIPGVSYSTALKITQVYKSMNNLIDQYNQCTEVTRKKNLLADICISEKRKVGKALSNKIYDALHQHHSVSLPAT